MKLGKVEGYAFRSAVKSLRGLIDAALAYDVNYGTYDSDANFADRLATNGARSLRASTFRAGPSAPSKTTGKRGFRT